MDRIVLNKEVLKDKTKLQWVIEKYGNKVCRVEKWGFLISDKGWIEVLTDSDEKLRKFASHLYYKGGLYNVIGKWVEDSVEEVRKNKKRLLGDDSVVDENRFYDYNSNLTQFERDIIRDTLYRKMKRDGIDW